MNKETGGPAFPAQFFDDRAIGMTLRQYAAIKLKVPDSGTDWLDEMIRDSLRDEFAAKSIDSAITSIINTGMGNYVELTYEQVVEEAYGLADQMLKAREA